jgi:hypothetical protein
LVKDCLNSGAGLGPNLGKRALDGRTVKKHFLLNRNGEGEEFEGLIEIAFYFLL